MGETMNFAPANRDDISRYYRGTFLKLREFGDQLFFIEQVDSFRVAGKHESGDPFVIYLDDATPYEVDYILPHKSFFQFGQHAVMLRRIPARQYFRGLCDSNTQLEYLGPAGMKNVPLDFSALKAFVGKQKFFTLQGAIGADVYTAALSPRLMYHHSKREIYMDFVPIARVQPNKLQIIVTKPIFLDEVNEMLRNSGDDKVFKASLYTPPPPKEKTTTADLLKEMQKAAPAKEMDLEF